MIDLSIIIVNLNTKKLVVEALTSIEASYPKEMAEGKFEVIVSDNGSTDGSMAAFREYKKQSAMKLLILLDNKRNLGFAKGNNVGVKKAKGRYILFLNPDTVMYPKTLTTLLEFMDSHPQAGAVGCQVNVPTGGIDEASHRGFPTPWNAFTHFSGLERKFPKSRIFAGYIRGWEDMAKIHEVPSIVGACMFVRREAGEQVGWWCEEYFFYGEDLDFCYSLWEEGWKIYYIPTVHILHYGGVTIGIKKYSQLVSPADIEKKKFSQLHRFEAMRIFYKRHYMQKYPKFVTWAVFKGIDYLYRKNISQITVQPSTTPAVLPATQEGH